MLENHFEVFPRNARLTPVLIHILLSGEAQRLTFSLGRFTGCLELAKCYSISCCELSVFSPQVLCWSKKFCIWKQIALSKGLLVWPPNSPDFPDPWSSTVLNDLSTIYLNFMGEEVSDTSWSRPQQGWFCLSGGHWQYLETGLGVCVGITGIFGRGQGFLPCTLHL
jgi:hypothetical protein